MIGQKEIETTINCSDWSKQVSRDDKSALKTLETDLRRMVFGQDQACQTLVRDQIVTCGLREPETNWQLFVFWANRRGKTAARQLSEILGVKLIRFDMSEYMERHTVSRLIGAPPGYVGLIRGH